jgi:hypothetical protein
MLRNPWGDVDSYVTIAAQQLYDNIHHVYAANL